MLNSRIWLVLSNSYLFLHWTATTLLNLSDLILQEACNRTGKIGHLGSQWKMSKQIKCLFAKDFRCKTFPLQEHLFCLQDHTINSPGKNNIIFFCIEKSKKVDLGILKTSYLSKFLAFCHFVIDTINWKWDFVSYNSRVIGLVISNQPSANPDYFQNCTPLSPITITYTFSSSNHLSCWASASRSIRSVVSSFSTLIVEAVGLGGWNTQN